MRVEYPGLELSTQILINGALERGIWVEVLDAADNFIRLRQDDHLEYVKQATRTRLDTYIAPLIMENKEVTKMVLREQGINVPKGVMAPSVAEAMDQYSRFAGDGALTRPVVVKPKSTNFGKGITILKTGYGTKDFQMAVQRALEEDNSVLIEEFIPGKEYRFLVIGDEVVAVLHRVPANVKGDGKHTISELVAEKNQDPLRGKGYVTPLEKINLGSVEAEYLKAQGKDFLSVPAMNEIVYLRENSNISTGGDSIDYTDEVAESYKNIAVRAAKAVGAKICGVDIMIQDFRLEPTETNYGVIELNFNPALHIHNYPYQGKNRRVEQKVLDLLGFSTQSILSLIF
jgi:glutamate--cysteine ligase/glutathione synthase